MDFQNSKILTILCCRLQELLLSPRVISKLIVLSINQLDQHCLGLLNIAYAVAYVVDYSAAYAVARAVGYVVTQLKILYKQPCPEAQG